MTIAVLVLAIVAGARGTWSPCGLSMLSTITPISERGRGNRYAATARWYVAGALVGGLCLGAVLSTIAALSPVESTALVALAALVGAGSDARLGGWTLPTHRRQVNERWLDRYRPWVYGGGFGWQIGTGAATYITTSAIYLLFVASLTVRPVTALLAGALFGAVRGAAVWLPRHVATAAQLQRLHAEVHRAGPWLHLATIAAQCAVALVAAPLTAPFGAVVLVAAWRKRSGLVCDLDAERRNRKSLSRGR